MSQNWTADVFAAGHVGQTDLQNMENNFGCLKSLFSGASQPASMAPCHPWFDTTKHVLKVRNDGDSAWYGLMHGDVSQKLWVYRNAAMSGWAVDSGVSDKVLALKGGSTYTTGGATAGTWTQPNHTLVIGEVPGHTHTFTYTMGGSADGTPLGVYTSGSYRMLWSAGGGANNPLLDAGGGGAHNHGSTYRPAAGVGTLQYLDL